MPSQAGFGKLARQAGHGIYLYTVRRRGANILARTRNKLDGVAGMTTVAVRGDKSYSHGGESVDGVADYVVADGDRSGQNSAVRSAFGYRILARPRHYQQDNPKHRVTVSVSERAGVRACECVVFDDVAAALRSAKRAGMTTVAVRGDKSYSHGGVSVLSDALPHLVTVNYKQRM